MHEMNVQRFRVRYDKWRAGQSEAVVGTPLNALPGMTPSKVEEYKYFKVVTVEQLSEASDQLGQKFMTFQADKARAKAFLEVAAGNAPIERMNAELAKRDEEIEALKAQMAALMANTKQRKVTQTAEAQEA
jgi:CRISPR/Cas system CSM-associated protein Csm2 small subunit